MSALPWKMLVGPGLLLALKFGKVDYQSPDSLLIIRVLYGASQVFLLALCSYIALAIRDRGDGTKTVKIVTPPAGAEEEPKVTKVTFKDYDMGEIGKLAKNFVLGAAVTIGIHVYMQVVPALLLQIVTQPITLIEHPLFSIYVLKKDPAKDSKLKRPFADNSPAARIEAMKQEEAKRKLLQQEREQLSSQSVTESESAASEETSSDTATGGNAQASLTTAERRSTRSSNSEVKEE